MSNNFEDLLKISKILTREYISEHLSRWFNDDIQLTKYSYEDGVAKGESYLSDVYRLTLFGKLPSENEVSLKILIKTLPSNIARRRTFRSTDFFGNEINFYLYVIPELINFQSSKRMSSPIDIFPRLFAAVTDGENDFLALEDLSTFDFTTIIRQEGIDYNHSLKILECFAKFHALSFAYKDQYPEKFANLMTKVYETYYDEKYWNWYKNFWKSLCECAIDAVEKEYPNTIYVDKIKEFAREETYFKAIKAVKNKGKSAVFSHGDSWTPNFLMKYKSGTNIPEEAKMIDFQLTRCASPVLDVGFFIYACSTEDLRKQYYHHFLQHYHNVLSNQIKKLGSDPVELYSWNEFMNEVKEYSYFGLAFSLESTPVIILDPEDAFEMDSLQGTDKVDITKVWIIKPIKKQAGRLRLANNIVHAVENNYI